MSAVFWIKPERENKRSKDPALHEAAGASRRSAGVLTGSTTARRSDAAGRHAIHRSHALYACHLRGEVGRRRVGPRVHDHRLRLLAPAMS